MTTVLRSSLEAAIIIAIRLRRQRTKISFIATDVPTTTMAKRMKLSPSHDKTELKLPGEQESPEVAPRRSAKEVR